MRILHTSDWHLGKVLKGQSRTEEQIAVLAEIVAIATQHRPDLIIVAGDLFDNAAPTAETKKLMVRALSALRRQADSVVVIAGNHDHGAELDALRPWAQAVGIALRGTVGKAEEHVITGVTSAGEKWRIAALPFVSQRYAVRAAEMFELTAAQASSTYADHVSRLIAALTNDFGDDAETINLITTHLTVFGGKLGGGERDAHTIDAYSVPTSVFPASTHYVALGHLHRRQQLVGPCPVHYSGSPFAIDFGEEQNTPSVSIVEVGPAKAAKVTVVPVSAALPLLTVRGSLAELAGLHVDESAWLRVFLREAPRAGLKDDVLALLPRTLEVRLDNPAAPAQPRTSRPSNGSRTPAELFGDYLASRGVADPAVGELFNQIYDQVHDAGVVSPIGKG